MGIHINIAICDNNPVINNLIAGMIDDYQEERSVNFDYEMFTSYNQLADKINSFDLFILDYNMSDGCSAEDDDGTDGLTFARHIRDVSGSTKGIIFITAYPDFVYEAFEVRTFRFLTKPIDKNKLFDALDDYINHNSESAKIIVNIRKTNHIINVNDIYYIEIFGKSATIYFKDGSLKCHRTISSFEEELSPFGFCRILRQFLVNKSKIKMFNGKTVTLNNGTELSVSTKYCANLFEPYFTQR